MEQAFLIIIGTLASEDLTCIATGGLVSAGKIGFAHGVLACLVGIFVSDLLLYFGGRLVGRPIVNWGPLQKILTVEKIDLASRWLMKRGASVVLLSRFTPGLRLPVYVAAGLLKTHFLTFAAYFLLAAALWTPALVGAAALLGKSFPKVIFLGPAAGLVIRMLPAGALSRTLRDWLGIPGPPRPAA
jgi:membrane protein DedA with SNARE-associated domain